MSENMSLIAIDDTISQLMALRDEPDLKEDEKVAIDGQIEEWVNKELRKFDSCYGYIRHEEQQAAIAKEVAQKAIMWQHTHENRAIRMRGIIKQVMENRGLKKVEGPVGSFTVRPSGGVRALDIVNEAIVPEEYRIYRVELSYHQWQQLQCALRALGDDKCTRVVAVVDSKSIRAALEAGIEVPGAKLAERGSSLVVR